MAARGIHVDDVGAVVHFDPPEDGATYVHRSGRTARAGASGVVLSMVEPSATKATTAMQRKLGLPTGVTDPDIEAVRSLELPRPDAAPSGDTRNRPKGDSGDASRANGRADARNHDAKARKRGRHDQRADGGRQPRDGKGRDGKGRDGQGRDGQGREGQGRDRRKRDENAGRDELTGRVVNYSHRKGFGFIKVKGRNDVFVHISGVNGEPSEVLAKGNQVAFRLTDGNRGPVAVEVRSLAGSAS